MESSEKDKSVGVCNDDEMQREILKCRIRAKHLYNSFPKVLLGWK